MTREEALFNVSDRGRGMVNMVNDIYNDFEKQQLQNIAHLQMANDEIERLKKDRSFLEKESELKVKIDNLRDEREKLIELKSRTCESCKYWNEFNRCESGVTPTAVTINGETQEISDSFSCNKWEAKDAK